jgi:HEAT repeat protein
VGLFGPPDIPRLKARGDVSGLIKALGNWHVGDAASEALAEMGAPAVEPLIAALDATVWMVRSRAARALGRIGDPRAVGPLAARLGDEESAATAAAEALGWIGDPRAVEPLAVALRTPSITSDTKLRAVASALGRIGDRRSVEALVTALEHRDARVRRAAAESLDALRLAGRLPDEPEAKVDLILARPRSGSAAEPDPSLLRKPPHDDAPRPTFTAPRDDHSGHRDVMIEASSDCTDTHDDSATGYWR